MGDVGGKQLKAVETIGAINHLAARFILLPGNFLYILDQMNGRINYLPII